MSSHSEEERQLEGISDRLMAEANTVKRLERERRSYPISSPRFQELADEIADHARHVFRLAEEQEETGERIPPDDDDIDDVAQERRRG